MRKCNDWLDAFVDYASFGEAPRHVYFWCGASALAGALRRHVWIDQVAFQWHPNLFIILVAPPGIISKSTTADMAMLLLREVPGVHFGPSVVTWQALVSRFAEVAETFQIGATNYIMSPMTISSSEFGNLLDPRNRELVDMLVNIYDGRPFDKATKNSGCDTVVNPWLNLLACTTPEWIASTFPEYMIGGGFTSRCIFIFAEEKSQYVAWPSRIASKDTAQKRADLIHDLEHIAINLKGEYKLTKEAMDWGEVWYREHYQVHAKLLDPTRFGGYIARKQTQACKVAMILAASKRDELIITQEDFSTAIDMLTDLEPTMDKVFEKIGITGEAVQSDRFAKLVTQRGRLSYGEACVWLKRYFPHKTAIEDILAAGVAAGQYHLESAGPQGPVWIVAGLRNMPAIAPVISISKAL